jgi:hypothetical protein
MAAWLTGCSEPDRRVTASVGEGELTLTLEAIQDWVAPGGSVPIRVELTSPKGPVTQAERGTVEFVANNGSVSPERLAVALAGPDSLGAGAEERFTAWITFTAWPNLTAADQGEVHALFRDTAVTLKIRIAVPGDG